MSIKGLKKDQYDVVIIGAGIGGLVCGCYLAKAGLKVLIVEKNDKPGGYCRSFMRGGFTFDACVHYLGSYREDGQLRCVIRELNLENKIDMLRMNPSNLMITPKYKIAFYNDIDRTIDNLQKKFFSERENIKNFFKVIKEGKFIDKVTYFKKFTTFDQLLKEYFKNRELQAILSIPLLNLGLLAEDIFGISAVVLYREFILDGGYYPKGGMRSFLEAFLTEFKNWGGKIKLNTKVNKIIVRKNKVSGVMLEKDNIIYSKYVISSADSTQTFLNLVGKENLPNKFIQKIENKIPSMSMFILYLGINKESRDMLSEKFGALWYWPMYEWNHSTIDITINRSPFSGFFCSIPSMYEPSYAPVGNESVRLSALASFKDDGFWKIYKNEATEILLKRAEKLFPNLSKYIVVKETATPQSLYKYTSNYQGAIYGWASLPGQVEECVSFKTPINNLYLCSQWVAFFGIQGGVSMVSFIARHVANFILRKIR